MNDGNLSPDSPRSSRNNNNDKSTTDGSQSVTDVSPPPASLWRTKTDGSALLFIKMGRRLRLLLRQANIWLTAEREWTARSGREDKRRDTASSLGGLSEVKKKNNDS